jgi:hypothetical protein
MVFYIFRRNLKQLQIVMRLYQILLGFETHILKQWLLVRKFWKFESYEFVVRYHHHHQRNVYLLHMLDLVHCKYLYLYYFFDYMNDDYNY